MDNFKQDLNNFLVKINFDNAAIKYCVYRTALKLCCVQEKFYLTKITISSIIDVVAKFSSVEGDNNNVIQFIYSEMMTFKQLVGVVKAALDHATTVEGTSDEMANLLSVLVYEMYKDVHENKIALIAVVLFFIVMSGDELPAKYKKLYEVYSGPLSMLSKCRAGLLLTHFIRVTDVISESANFGKITSNVESCFDGIIGNMISENQFLHWMLSEPQLIVWLPTMHRLNLSKTSIHDIQCSTCKTRPIIGMRFQCLKCLDFNSCQVCFLTQQNTSRSHKVQHPLQEYCLPAGSKDKVNAIARTLRNIVTKRYKHKPLSSHYLPTREEASPCSASNSVENSVGNLTSMAEEENRNLEKIVHKLKKENRKITGTVHMLEASKKESHCDVDDDHSLLQSRLDTVTLHNQSLQAELDNLKCVVFSENFIPKSSSPDQRVVTELNLSQDHDDEWNTTLSSDALESNSKLAFESPSKVCSKDENKRIKTEVKTTRNEVSNKAKNLLPEDQLTEFVQQLSASMCDGKPLDSLVFREICQAADKVSHQINELIDSALKI